MTAFEAWLSQVGQIRNVSATSAPTFTDLVEPRSLKGHKDAFPRPRPSDRSLFSQATFAGARGNHGVALFGQFPRPQRAQRRACGTAVLGPTWEVGLHDAASQRLFQQFGREIVDIDLGAPVPQRRGVSGLFAYGDIDEASRGPFATHELAQNSRAGRDV